jgi:DNA-directed RNA polymerase specialized sigma24 family protein
LQPALSREQIIEALYNSPEIASAIAKMNPPELREDLKQEMFVAICELSAEKLIEIFEHKYLLFYAYKIMTNMVKSSSSKFYKVFRRVMVSLADMNDKPVYYGDEACDDLFTRCQFLIAAADREEAETGAEHLSPLDKVEPAIESLEFYERGLFKVYVESSNSCAAVARKTGIPETSVRIGVRAAKSKLKRLIRA